MSPKFNYVVCSIEKSKDIDALSFDKIVNLFVSPWSKDELEFNSKEQALKASTFNPSSNSRGRGRDRDKRREVEVSNSKLMMIKAKVEDKINKLINPRWSALDAISLVIIVLNIIISCLTTKKKGREIQFCRKERSKDY